MPHRVVKGHTVDDHEVLQVVFVRRVVPVPGHHVERGEILCSGGAQIDNNTSKDVRPHQQTKITKGIKQSLSSQLKKKR